MKFQNRINKFCSEAHRTQHTTSDSKQTQQLMSDAVTTSDESPLDTGIGAVKAGKRKPRHPPAPPPSVELGADFSSKSVLLFPGQGFQFVGMGKKVLGKQPT